MFCFLCGKFATDEHHVFNGWGHRSMSEKDGMKVYLCHECHMKIHNNYAKRIELKKMAQRVWEKTYGDRGAFRERYGKSYL